MDKMFDDDFLDKPINKSFLGKDKKLLIDLNKLEISQLGGVCENQWSNFQKCNFHPTKNSTTNVSTIPHFNKEFCLKMEQILLECMMQNGLSLYK